MIDHLDKRLGMTLILAHSLSLCVECVFVFGVYVCVCGCVYMCGVCMCMCVSVLRAAVY